ncbi:MAG: hypothetical protein NZ519_06115 [Bacteroidia bacterium]|nr:hypothetical protein [Bacteroidia bacterium]MDW8301435.1 hypothetical protein [Bacteroidia bacterium]
MLQPSHRWVLPILLISFVLYNVGVPVFVHFCASKNNTQTHIIPQKHVCSAEKRNESKSCCEKKPKAGKNTHSIPNSKSENNCYGEYFAPSDCCKLTYQIKQNHQQYLSESSKKIVKKAPAFVPYSKRYIAGIPVPICKHRKKHCEPSSIDISPIEYFPLRL